MQYKFAISYLNCQSCTAKVHCDDCAATVRERLLLRPGLSDIEIDIPKRTLSLQAGGLDEDDIIDILEDVSIFAD